jgi:hypothetical protein
MKGYVKHIGKAPMYIFKGVVNSDETIGFDALLKRFGTVAGTSSEEEFAVWLVNNKFMDKNRWKIITEKPTKKVVKEPPIEEVKPVVVKSELEKVESISRATAFNKEIIRQSVTGVKKEVTVDYIIDIKTVNMKRDVGNIDDLKLLKVALKKAEGMTKKATLCNALRDRITELSVR